MFLSLDFPIVKKKAIHRRSKTITVLVNQQKTSKQTVTKRKSYQSNKTLKFTEYVSKNSQKRENSQNLKMSSFKRMTDQIQKLINRELKSPQLLTYISRGSSRIQKEQQNVKNPEKEKIQNEIGQSAYCLKYQENTQNNSVFRQSQYLSLLKRTQVLNSRSFVPHYNWKQKLSKLKNMGNYGSIYKKSNSKVHRQKIIAIAEQETSHNYAVDSTKMSIDPYNQCQKSMSPKKKLSYNRCKTTSNDDYNFKLQVNLKQNKTGDNFHLRKFSQGKYESKRGKLSERQWKFQPWDGDKDIHNLPL